MCVYIEIQTCTYMCIFGDMSKYVHIYTYVFIYAYRYLYMYMRVFIYAYIHTCLYMGYSQNLI